MYKFNLELKPNFITMDINMPVMNGLEAIEEIMAKAPTPILVISSVDDSKIAFDACAKGAMDVFAKADVDPDKAHKLIDKIKSVAGFESVETLSINPFPNVSINETPYDGENCGYQRVI